jgi:fucose 4-O-acetylase-like acetyltransferase
MPLFMIVSGYLFAKKMNQSHIPVAFAQFRHLIIPNIFWGVVAGVTVLVLNHNLSVKSFIQCTLRSPVSFWFLSTLFVLSLCYKILYSKIKNQYLLTAVLSIAILLLPGMQFNKFMMPFFGIGLMLAQKDYFHISSKKLMIISGSVFIALLLLLYNFQSPIYVTNLDLFHGNIPFKLYEMVVRLVTGISAFFFISQFFILYAHKIPVFVTKLLSECSKLSLGIYILHYIALSYFLPFIHWRTVWDIDTYSWEYTFVFTPVVAFILTSIVCLVIKLVSRNKWLAFICFGTDGIFKK